MKFIKKATKAERYGGVAKQRTMQSLREKHGFEIVYMPYGTEGLGFYLNEAKKYLSIDIKNMLIAKMKEQKIQDLSDIELIRVFKNCVAPNNCFRGVKRLIEEGLILSDVLQ